MSDLTRNDLRRAVLQRLDTFTQRVEWVGDGADYGFADSVIAFAEWFASIQPADTARPTDRQGEG